jgi:phosphatidylserine/phosphatidylglycerophosphate/cardiolipin synthase-like enzyme
MPRVNPSSPIEVPVLQCPRGEAGLVVDGDHFQRVVRDGILKAKTSLDIATADFKAMLVPTPGRKRAKPVVDVLRDLASRGVEIRLLHSGVPSSLVLGQFRRELPDAITIRRCPRMHAKVVIVDCRAMYVGSANLTGAGLGAKAEGRRNFEMGIWTCAVTLIDPVLEHFNAIWEGRFCETCRRHNLCPVPLEEPSPA